MLFKEIRVIGRQRQQKNQIEESIYGPETNKLLTYVYVFSQEKADL